ncbi:ABC transporter ATP-binding protein [Candidatus Acetothermia bacterium]|nr:MAG: ABC transporter ATP-binding protein [Candidatus Acetothermia bacterium]
MAGLEAQGLTKRFGRVVAAREVSFLVKEGELFALLGPSGCGKTTVLRLLAGLAEPDSGRVFIAGREVTALPPERRGVGMVFQTYALFPHLTVSGNIAYGLRFGRLSRRARARRVEELLELVELPGYGRRRVHELSQGQRQRVALARALAPRPKVLLLDEPLSALDAALRLDLRKELRALLKGLSITSVHVTHDQGEALAISDRLGVMRAGELVEVGPPEALYRAPRTPFVASFLGRANLWPAVVVETGEGVAVVEVGGERIACEGEDVPPGTEVLLFSRPEEVQLGAGDLRAEVKAAEFLGDRWEVHAVFTGQPLILYSPAPVRPGETVAFGFSRPPRLLPREGETAQ